MQHSCAVPTCEPDLACRGCTYSSHILGGHLSPLWSWLAWDFPRLEGCSAVLWAAGALPGSRWCLFLGGKRGLSWALLFSLGKPGAAREEGKGENWV